MSAAVQLALLLACFFLSGFAALLFETAWMREFAFAFGTSELAVATVLGACMAGLALGAAAAGRWAGRVARPLRAYALLEVGIALGALAVPHLVRGSHALLRLAFGGRAELPGEAELATASFTALSAFAVLLIPTALMGASLPLLARHAVRREHEIGRRVGLLYAVNTAGAVAGALITGFALLPVLGLRASVWIGAGVNLLVAGGALALAAASPPLPVVPRSAARGRRVSDPLRALVFFAGAAAFGYEVLWTRLLGQLLGGSVYAFATVLASFLTGIAVGAAIAARGARSRPAAARGLAFAQLGAAAGALLAWGGVGALPELALRLGAGPGAGLLANAALAAAVLVPGALCMGATFPLAVRASARDESDAASASARVYAWNTLGAIAGALGAGFVGIPLLGFEGLLRLAVVLNLGVAAAALRLAAPPRRRVALALLAVAALALWLRPQTPWRLLRASPFATATNTGEVAFFAAGRAASVLLLDHGSEWQLRTNGLPEAAIEPAGGRAAREKLAAWLGALPVLARPDTASMLVIGFGGGVALEAVPASVGEIDVIELEPQVLAANRVLNGARRRNPLADPRVRVTVNDARGALLLTERRWDAIVSQPSHPWTAGAAHLYTREFFAAARDHLTAEGVFEQWIGLAFVDDALLRSLVATLLDVFPHVRMYRPVAAGALLLASAAPLDPEGASVRALARAPEAFAELGLIAPEDVAAALALDGPGAQRFAAGAPLNTDDHNRLAARSPRLGSAALRGAGASRLLAPHLPDAGFGAGLDRVAWVRRLLERRELAQARRVSERISDPALRETAVGFTALERDAFGEAEARFERALEIDPRALAADAGRLLARLRAGRPPALLASAPDALAAVAAGWPHAADADPAALRALEQRLAAIGTQHPLHREASELRARWRVAAGGAEHAREALALLDPLLARRATGELLLLRARAAAEAGYLAAALGDVSDAAAHAPPRRPDFARQALGTLASLPLDDALREPREALRTRLRRLLE